MKKISLLLLLLALLFLLGCPLFDPVERATKNIKDGLDSASKGMTDMSHIDPVGLNKLLTENQDLRNKIEDLRKRLQEVDGVASVHVGPGSEVRLEITGYKGRLRISGWVDNDRNKFIDNRVLSLVEKPFVLDKKWSDISSMNRDDPWQRKDEILAQTAQESFNKYLADPFVTPSGDLRVHTVSRRFLIGGDHSVLLQVTPEALDAHGQWELEYKMYVQTPNGQDNVTVGRMDSQSSKYELGKAMTPKEIAFATVTVTPGAQ